MPANSPHGGDSVEESSLSEAGETDDQILDWLSRQGLGESNPFALLDAGSDPDLSRYLVRNDIFDILWQDSPAIVYAPAGGGKSAFRVRLTHACRVEEDGRRIFSIPYLEPSVDSLDAHLGAIFMAAALELLLVLTYRPERFLSLDRRDQEAVRNALDENAPGLLRRFLPQIKRTGSLNPLAETFDPSAAVLKDPATPYKVRALCTTFSQIPPKQDSAPSLERFDSLIRLLLGTLGFEAIYLVVDGVDAYLATMRDPKLGLRVLEPLLEQISPWTERGIYLKMLLPEELRRILPNDLTQAAEVAIIEWTPDSLVKIIQARLRAASNGRFDSLDKLSGRSIRNAEAELLKAVLHSSRQVPREMLVLMNRVLFEHVSRGGDNGDIELEDVQAAVDWYLRTHPNVSPP